MEIQIEKIDETTANIIIPQPDLVITTTIADIDKEIEDIQNKIDLNNQGILANQNQINFLNNEITDLQSQLANKTETRQKLLEKGLKLTTEE